MAKTEPWQFERTIGDVRYAGIAWGTDRPFIIAVAALFTLKHWNEEPHPPDLIVRKIPAVVGREERFLILSPDPLDTRTEWKAGEREMYVTVAKEIQEYLGKM